jgi:hypothetical protein
MAVNIYVGNLPWSTSTDELFQLFAQYGQVERAQVVMDRDTGRSRGFAFVEMPNEVEAQAAIEALNHFQIHGRPLTVNMAQPREARPPRPYGGGGGRGGYGGGRGGYGGGRGNGGGYSPPGGGYGPPTGGGYDGGGHGPQDGGYGDDGYGPPNGGYGPPGGGGYGPPGGGYGGGYDDRGGY